MKPNTVLPTAGQTDSQVNSSFRLALNLRSVGHPLGLTCVDFITSQSLFNRPRPHECVFKSLRFPFTENSVKVLCPHDRFHRAFFMLRHCRHVGGQNYTFSLPWEIRSIFMQNCFIVSALQHGRRENPLYRFARPHVNDEND